MNLDTSARAPRCALPGAGTLPRQPAYTLLRFRDHSILSRLSVSAFEVDEHPPSSSEYVGGRLNLQNSDTTNCRGLKQLTVTHLECFFYGR